MALYYLDISHVTYYMKLGKGLREARRKKFDKKETEYED